MTHEHEFTGQTACKTTVFTFLLFFYAAIILYCTFWSFILWQNKDRSRLLCILSEYKGKRTFQLTGNNSNKAELISTLKLTFDFMQREVAPDCSADWQKQFLLRELQAHTAEMWFRLAWDKLLTVRIGKAPEQRCREKRREDLHYYRILEEIWPTPPRNS